MRFTTLLSGGHFNNLLAHGREVERVITRADNTLLQHSTPELERWFDKPPAELPRQNGFPLAFVLFFFLLAYAGNILTLLALLPKLTPPVRATLFFVPGIVFIFSNITASYFIARGKTSGLELYGWVYVVLTVLSTVLLIMTLLNGQTHHAIIMLASLISMLACRYVFNGRGFIQFVLYGRTQRIAMLSRERRAKSGTKMQ